jgi:hypothetical protein
VVAVVEVEVEVEDVEELLVLDPPLTPAPVGLPPNPKAVKLYTGTTSDVEGKKVALSCRW